jgi:C-terminal processing protease CtpA/Prc
MRSLLSAALMWTVLTVPGQTQDVGPGPELEGMLTFETAHSGTLPAGWGGGPAGTVSVDDAIVHGGRLSARLERTAASPQAFSSLTKTIPMDFAGTTIEWRGFLRSETVSEFMGLWMRQDGDAPNLAFASMQPRQIRGTNDWTEYSITLPVDREAKRLVFGVLLGGTGRVWADDLRLLVDGRPVWEAPKVERPKTPIDLDREFDAGSGVVISKLTPAQIENLAMLGKVWGFLKYHHPAVTTGSRHWDYDLFRVLPAVLAARDHDAGSVVLRDWIRGLGPRPSCDPCLTLRDENLQLRPGLAWIETDTAVGRELAGLLRATRSGRGRGGQFFVSQVPGIGNPRFDNEPAYAGLRFPDAGYQLLALYRFWNIVEYWFPYRDLLDGDWDRVLAEFVPRVALAADRDAYQLEIIQLIARANDTHANLWSAPPQLRPPAGDCQLPVTIRFLENQAVVTRYSDAATGPATGLRVGDVIERLDGVPVAELLVRWEPYYPASNRPTRLRDIARAMTRGPCVAAGAVARRTGEEVRITAQRQSLASLDPRAGLTHDLPGEAFRLLSDEVAYLKLSSVQAAQVSGYVERAKGTRGLVIDIRNYPSEFVVFALGSLLVDRPTPFARFTIGDLEHPGAFRWSDPVVLSPQQPHYAGKVVILVDEISLSQAEYTAMAFRSSPRAVVVGSTTAGADGNVSPIPLPGGLSSMISGIGVFYPDKTPTQRVGIVADVEAHPTIAGIRAGRDEVLEEALRQILGPDAPAARIENMARPRP